MRVCAFLTKLHRRRYLTDKYDASSLANIHSRKTLAGAALRACVWFMQTHDPLPTFARAHTKTHSAFVARRCRCERARAAETISSAHTHTLGCLLFGEGGRRRGVQVKRENASYTFCVSACVLRRYADMPTMTTMMMDGDGGVGVMVMCVSTRWPQTNCGPATGVFVCHVVVVVCEACPTTLWWALR